MSYPTRDVNGAPLEVGAVVRYRFKRGGRGQKRWYEAMGSDLRLTARGRAGHWRGVYVDQSYQPAGFPENYEWGVHPQQIEAGSYVVVSRPREETER